MNNWKLPSHLEPYREFIYKECNHLSVEDNAKTKWFGQDIDLQIKLLQRLYDAGKLK